MRQTQCSIRRAERSTACNKHQPLSKAARNASCPASWLPNPASNSCTVVVCQNREHGSLNCWRRSPPAPAPRQVSRANIARPKRSASARVERVTEGAANTKSKRLKQSILPLAPSARSEQQTSAKRLRQAFLTAVPDNSVHSTLR